MINLLRADLYLLKKSRAIWIMILLGAAMSIALVLTLKYAVGSLPPSDIGPGSNKMIMGWSMANFEADRFNGLYISSQIFSGNGDTIPALIGIFVCLFVVNEFSGGTIKNILSKGYTKSAFYFSKLITVSVSSVAIMLSMVVVTFITGCFTFGFGTGMGIYDIAGFLLKLILQSFLHIAFAALFLMIAMLMKNMGGSIAVSICVVILSSIIFPVMDGLSDFGRTVSSYWIDSNIATLTAPSPSSVVMLKALFVGISFIVIPSCIGVFIFKKQDVR